MLGAADIHRQRQGGRGRLGSWLRCVRHRDRDRSDTRGASRGCSRDRASGSAHGETARQSGCIECIGSRPPRGRYGCAVDAAPTGRGAESEAVVIASLLAEPEPPPVCLQCENTSFLSTKLSLRRGGTWLGVGILTRSQKLSRLEIFRIARVLDSPLFYCASARQPTRALSPGSEACASFTDGRELVAAKNQGLACLPTMATVNPVGSRDPPSWKIHGSVPPRQPYPPGSGDRLIGLLPEDQACTGLFKRICRVGAKAPLPPSCQPAARGHPGTRNLNPTTIPIELECNRKRVCLLEQVECLAQSIRIVAGGSLSV